VRGFSLVEVLIAMAIVLVLAAGLVVVSVDAQAYMAVQPELADLSQRLRGAVGSGGGSLAGDLRLAGAGPYRGIAAGSLPRWIPAIYPDRRVMAGAGGPAYEADAITILRVPDDAAQAGLAHDMRDTADLIAIARDERCPVSIDACGFAEGQRAILFDRGGDFDLFTVDRVEPLQFAHDPARLSSAYRAADEPIVSEVVAVTYYHDPVRRQLRRSLGPHTDAPVADEVVEVGFEYFGDPRPPEAPRLPESRANCLADEEGRARLAVLPVTDGALARLAAEQLTDGPFCGEGDQRFDADLYRLRRVRVVVRVQVALQSLRGRDPLLFRIPGTAGAVGRQVPDLALRFDVSPRNLQLR
jgi:prepilin-type N-terminal cleavage/methylation domain-containing protein